jgi:ferrous iron transport protein A
MISKESTIVLKDMKDGQAGIIVSVAGGKNATKRLADMGLTPGTMIKIVRKSLFSGPVQIEVCGSRLVIGAGLASKIVAELL